MSLHPTFRRRNGAIKLRSFLLYPSSTTAPLSYLQLLPTMVVLATSDHEQFVVDKEVAERSVLIKNMLEGIDIF